MDQGNQPKKTAKPVPVAAATSGSDLSHAELRAKAKRLDELVQTVRAAWQEGHHIVGAMLPSIPKIDDWWGRESETIGGGDAEEIFTNVDAELKQRELRSAEEEVRKSALEKLTPAEKRVLGLNA